MSAPVEIRAATEGDVASVVALLELQPGSDPQAGSAQLQGRVARLIGDPRSRVLIGRSGATVCGVVSLTSRSTLTGAASEAWIEVLATPVDGHERVGRMLLEAAERASVELGCSRMVAEAPVARTAAHRLFEADGWTDVRPVSRRLGRSINHRPGLLNRFVAASTAAATAVSDMVAVDLRSARREATHREATRRASAVLEPLGMPIHAPGASPGGPDPTAAGWWIALIPLDGACTTAAAHGLAFAAALVHGSDPAAGVVVDLGSGRRWIGATGGGATLDGRPYHLAARHHWDHLPAGLHQHGVAVTHAPTVSLCELVRSITWCAGEVPLPPVTVHQLAAPLVILREAGLEVIDANGDPASLHPDPSPISALRLEPAPQHPSV